MMETSRTKLRREVREKRLAYFEKSQPKPHEDATASKAAGFPLRPSTSSGSRRSRGQADTLGLLSVEADTRLRTLSHKGSGDGDFVARGSNMKARRPLSANPSRGHESYESPGRNAHNQSGRKGRPSTASVVSRHHHPYSEEDYQRTSTGAGKVGAKPSRPTSARVRSHPKAPSEEFRRYERRQVSSSAKVSKSKPEKTTKINASKFRQSEFADFRKSSASDFRDGFVNEQSSSEEGMIKGSLFSQGRVDAGGDYDLSYSERVSKLWAPAPENDAVRASKFHSEYSAENMLHSLLGIRKVKAKLHDELLSSFLGLGSYKAILKNKRKGERIVINEDIDDLPNKRESYSSISRSNFTLNDANLHASAVESTHPERLKKVEKGALKEQVSLLEDGIKKQSHIDQNPVGIGNSHTSQGAENSPIRTSYNLQEAEDNSDRKNDEGDESGVEMDDVQFDVGALCNAAKQGDDVLRQYIKGLTQKVKSKKEKEPKSVDQVLDDDTPVRKDLKKESLFAPKMPERKFEGSIQKEARQNSRKSELVNAQLSEEPLGHELDKSHQRNSNSSKANFMAEGDVEAISTEHKTIVDVKETSGKNKEQTADKTLAYTEEENIDTFAKVGNFTNKEDKSEDVLDTLFEQNRVKKPVVKADSFEGPDDSTELENSQLVAGRQYEDSVFQNELEENKMVSKESLPDDSESVVSRVKEPAVSADILEKLLFDDSKPRTKLHESTNINGISQTEEEVGDSDLSANASNDETKLAGHLDSSDLDLRTFRAENRSFTPLQVVGSYNKSGVLTTSSMDAEDGIEEIVDKPAKDTFRVGTATLRRTFDMTDDNVVKDVVDPNINTPYHSKLKQSKSGMSFVVDPDVEPSLSASIPENEVVLSFASQQALAQPSKSGVAFEVDLASARKQPRPPPSTKPKNSRLLNAKHSSPIRSTDSPKRSRPKKSPRRARTPEAHKEEVRQFHEKDRRLRKLSTPRSPRRSIEIDPGASEDAAAVDKQALRISLSSSLDTSRPNQGAVWNPSESLSSSVSDFEVGAPFAHYSPRRTAPLQNEEEVLDRIANFDPSDVIQGREDTDHSHASPAQSIGQESEGVDDIDPIHNREQQNHFPAGRIPERPSEERLHPSRPRPSSANPKRSASQKPSSTQKNRPKSAHSKMYSSPDRSYDRKWPQSSMAWMSQQKLASGVFRDHEESTNAGEVRASGSKVRKSQQQRVNRDFARKEKPPIPTQTSRRDGEYIKVRASRIFDGSVARVLEGRAAAGVPPLTLQLIQDSPRGSESLSIWQLLPDEILLHIFSHIPQPALIACGLVCKRFHRIAMDDSLWRTISLANRDLTDFYLTYIGEKHPVRLLLHKCRGNLVTENGLRNLFRSCADTLQELNVTGCSKGSLQGDSILLHASRCYNLQALDASWCAVTDNGLSAILDGCPRLESICLNGCQQVSDQCLRQVVNKYGQNLQVLELCGCFNLSNETLIHLAETSNRLITLNISQCYKITDECICAIASKFQSLEHWQLKGCKELRDSCVKKIARHCKRLRTLSLASCPHITDVSLIEIATYLNSIRSLDVSGCRKVGNEGMRCLSTCCPFLQRLVLSSTSVTHKTVSSLASYACGTLEELKLNCCREITEASVIRLLKHCKKLKTLHLYGVKGLRNLGILKVQYPCIEYLEKTRPL